MLLIYVKDLTDSFWKIAQCIDVQRGLLGANGREESTHQQRFVARKDGCDYISDAFQLCQKQFQPWTGLPSILTLYASFILPLGCSEIN